MANRYEIEFADQAVDDLAEMRRFDRQKVVSAIERHLMSRPKAESRTRIKRMRQPFWSQFRLRVEAFRVYYDVDDERNAVRILRILRQDTEQTPTEPS